MIIIERTFKAKNVNDPNSQEAILVDRRVFHDDDYSGVQRFIRCDGEYKYFSVGCNNT